MAYTFMSITKIKNMGTMTAKYRHNYRKLPIDNVIQEQTHLNETLIPLPTNKDGQEMSYGEAFSDRINSLPYYSVHEIRKNQVLGYEILLTYSRDDGVDVDRWKKQSIDWLHQIFDRAGDGRSNVLGAVFHADETGNGHIHAFVVPIDERGHLNARRYTNGSRQMSDLQSSYAESVQNLGLERGLAGSSAHHKTIRKMYADLNNARKSVPDPYEGETAEEYKKRIIEAAETLYIAGKRKVDNYVVEQRRKADLYWQHQRTSAREDIDQAHKEVTEMKKEKAALNNQINSYNKEIDELAQQMYEIKMEIKNTQDDRVKAIKATRITVGLELIRLEDPSRAEEISDGINEAVEKAKEQERALSAIKEDLEIDQDI